MYQDVLFEIFTFGMPNAVFLVYSLVCKEWNLIIKNRKFLHNYHSQTRNGIEKLINPQTRDDKMFACWLEFISHSCPAEYEMGLILRRTMTVQLYQQTGGEKLMTTNLPLRISKYDVRFSIIDDKGDRISLFMSRTSPMRMTVCVNENSSEILADHLLTESSKVEDKYFYGKLEMSTVWFRKSLKNYIRAFSEQFMWSIWEGFTYIALDLPYSMNCSTKSLRMKSKAFFANTFGYSFSDPFVQKIDRSIQSVADRNSLLVKTIKVNLVSIAYRLLDMGFTLKGVQELEECCLFAPAFIKRGHLEFLLEYCERFGLNYEPLIARNLRKLVKSGRDNVNFLVERGIICKKFLFFILNSDTAEPEYERIDHLKLSRPNLICPFDIRNGSISTTTTATCQLEESNDENALPNQSDHHHKKFLILFHNTYSEQYSTDYLNEFCNLHQHHHHIDMMKMPRRFIRSNKQSKNYLTNQLQQYSHVLYYFDEIGYKKRSHFLGLVWKNINYLLSHNISLSLILSTIDLLEIQKELLHQFENSPISHYSNNEFRSYESLKILVMTDDAKSSYVRLNELLKLLNGTYRC